MDIIKAFKNIFKYKDDGTDEASSLVNGSTAAYYYQVPVVYKNTNADAQEALNYVCLICKRGFVNKRSKKMHDRFKHKNVN